MCTVNEHESDFYLLSCSSACEVGRLSPNRAPTRAHRVIRVTPQSSIRDDRGEFANAEAAVQRNADVIFIFFIHLLARFPCDAKLGPAERAGEDPGVNTEEFWTDSRGGSASATLATPVALVATSRWLTDE